MRDLQKIVNDSPQIVSRNNRLSDLFGLRVRVGIQIYGRSFSSPVLETSAVKSDLYRVIEHASANVIMGVSTIELQGMTS